MKLDSTTLRLLHDLDCDARRSYVSLAQTLRIPEETVRYRHRKLCDEGIIAGSYPVIDIGRLGATVHKVMLKLLHVDEQQIQKIARYIAKCPNVNWVCTFDGKYQLGMTLFADRPRVIVDFMNDLRKKFTSQIGDMSYAVNIDAEFFPRSYLNPKSKVREVAAYRTYADDRDLVHTDQIDWKILKSLSRDARTSISAIGQEAALTPEAVTRRIRKLERAEIIKGYRLNLNNERFGNLNYYILVYLSSASPDEIEHLYNHLRAHPCVVYLIRMLGAWDLDICIDVPDANAYRSFVLDLTKHFGSLIRHYETLLTWQIHAFSIMPPNREDLPTVPGV